MRGCLLKNIGKRTLPFNYPYQHNPRFLCEGCCCRQTQTAQKYTLCNKTSLAGWLQGSGRTTECQHRWHHTWKYKTSPETMPVHNTNCTSSLLQGRQVARVIEHLLECGPIVISNWVLSLSVPELIAGVWSKHCFKHF